VTADRDQPNDPFQLLSISPCFSERSPLPMVALEGPTQIVRYFNPAFATLASKAADELVGRPFVEAVPECNGNGCLAALNRVFHTGASEFLTEQEHRQTPSAYWSYALWAIPGTGRSPIGVMMQVTDATETAAFRQRSAAMNEALLVSSIRQHELIDTIQRGEQERSALQARLFQAQKLESLAVLSAGIAHDLNNILTPVLGFAELAAASLPADSDAASLLDAVQENVGRATDLVQQILAYAGKSRFVARPVDLSCLVSEMAAMLEPLSTKKVKLNYDLASFLPRVEADPAQVRQVVMNLVTNACDAIGDMEGFVTIRTGVRPAHSTLDVSDRPTVSLEVVDSGSGISPEVIDKIFDPFFTTKFAGRGLGLAVVQGIARAHRGSIRVRSSPGEGSTFCLLLPGSTLITS
jgi:signal transduction histidine kinase